MTVAASYTPNAYTANGSTTVFPYGFKIYDETHITVTVDGVTQTLTTDYTVSGVDNAGGGNVTFVVAPANGEVVSLLRSVGLSRDTDYQTNGELQAARLNEDLDRLWMALQEAVTTGTILSPTEFGAAIGGTQVLGYTAAGVFLRNLLLQGYQAVETAAPAISAGTLTLDMTTSSYFKVAHNANISTLTLSNILATHSTSFILELTQDATGGRTITWPASVRCAGGSVAATLAPTTTANAVNVYTFVTPNGGTTWFVGVQKDVKA
jgi:hypothetical protein